MPHNLYLHSAIVQSRAYDRTTEDGRAHAVRFATWDSNIQLGAAFFVNCPAAGPCSVGRLFYGKSADLSTFGALYDALGDPQLAGAVASPVLSTRSAVALLASGQNSTITGTLTGQVVMEGFIHMKIPLWMRRVVTRSCSQSVSLRLFVPSFSTDPRWPSNRCRCTPKYFFLCVSRFRFRWRCWCTLRPRKR